MSLETQIKNLTEAIVTLTEKLNSLPTSAVTPVVPAPVVPAPVVPAPVVPAPVVPAPVVPAPVVPTAMPPTPAFQQPVATPVQAPFGDIQGLINYATKKFHELGSEKGNNIQKVINELTGKEYSPITEIKPEQFGLFFSKVEAL